MSKETCNLNRQPLHDFPPSDSEESTDDDQEHDHDDDDEDDNDRRGKGDAKESEEEEEGGHNPLDQERNYDLPDTASSSSSNESDVEEPGETNSSKLHPNESTLEISKEKENVLDHSTTMRSSNRHVTECLEDGSDGMNECNENLQDLSVNQDGDS